MAGRYDLDKPNPLWKHMPKWAEADSEKMILSLHKIEKQIRAEIMKEQIVHWTPEMIRKRWPDGRA